MKNIAIIGSGISGLTSAFLLSKKHNITLFEKNSTLGGHTATVDIEYQGEQHAIDTGFIVFNDRTYPNFLALLEHIGVDKKETEMSFSVVNRDSGMEYNGHTLNTLFSQRKNVFSFSFWHLITDIVRFNRVCKKLYSEDDIDLSLTLGDFLDKQDFSEFFAQHYILPMGAAIWSTSLLQMKAFQLRFFIRFFHHHGLLNVIDRPQWYVIPEGSRSYIEPLIKSFKQSIELNSHIDSVIRERNGATIRFTDQSERHFDEVVFACHSDQALALLADPTFTELEVLGAMRYSNNEVVLHADEQLLPRYKRSWASWNYQLTEDRTRPASVTYNMNILQGIESKHTFCVSLNQTEYIEPSKVIRHFTYAHPIFDQQSQAAQRRRDEICGKHHTHYVGAYWYNGFHEDGVKSAVDVGSRFDCQLESESNIVKPLSLCNE
ncbi:NAD(P)/FAD-dependent oxidoreductase [Aliivibrio kagoshimensis]|uniref:NAD(P)/FAD-dependent oxidoreductase n=1 Tax=Aliivibrio kagoshimensis TaxID=2910230 RepID=UPI003D12AA31